MRYGDHPQQVANLHLPAGADGPWPCVVLVHGGFWRSGWDRTLMTPLALDLAERGLAVWNVEYRDTGADGGGWPTTLLDVAAAVDHLAGVPEVDTARIATCGHSAGGHLAVWLAARHRLAAAAPGATPRVRPVAAVSQAGVLDLVAGALDRLGNGAVQALIGGEPHDHPDRYAVASPAALVPLGVPQLLLHGAQDDVVPASQSTGYAALARAKGDDVELVVLEADHFDVIDRTQAAWALAADRLSACLGEATDP